MRQLASPFVVQKNHKTSLNPKQEKQVAELARLLARPHSGLGRVLRVLTTRIRQPEAPHTEEELETLLLVSLALQHARRAAKS